MVEGMIERVARAMCAAVGGDPDGQRSIEVKVLGKTYSGLNWHAHVTDAMRHIAAQQAMIDAALSPPVQDPR